MGEASYGYTETGDIYYKNIKNLLTDYAYHWGKLKNTRNDTAVNVLDYDIFGNVIKNTKYGLNADGYVESFHPSAYRYDEASRLIEVEANNTIKNYFYDGNGQRYYENLKGTHNTKYSLYVQSEGLLFEEAFSECSYTNYIRLGSYLVAQSVDQTIEKGLDSDSDTISDCLEIQFGLNPNDPLDATLDTDNDGLDNATEIASGLFISKSDSDGDGISDGDEVNQHNTDPLLADSDGDGIDDSVEIVNGLNPTLADLDRDGVNDLDENQFGLNPLDALDGVLDLDGDGYSNRQESLGNSDLGVSTNQPTDGKLAWFTDTLGAIDKAMSVDFDGNLYVGTREGYLYSLYPNGEERWKFKAENRILSTPAIGLDGTIYVGSDDGKLYAVNPDGTEKWHYQTYGDIETSPSIASDGTIYVASYDENLYALNEDGSLKWIYRTPGDVGYLSSPAIGADGTIYIGALDSGLPYLIAVSSEGELKWRYLASGNVKSSPAIGQNGDLFFYADDGFVYSVTKNGDYRWKFYTGETTPYSQRWSVVLGKNDTVYSGTADGELVALDRAGQLLWVFDPLGTPFTPAIAEDGTVYVGAASGYLYAINSDGTQKWRYPYGYLYLAPPTIDIDGTIYIGDRSSRLQAFIDNNGGLSTSSWPMFGRDRFSSGNQCRNGAVVYAPGVDSDSDKIPDCIEYLFGLNPQNSSDATIDSDGDSITNLEEYFAGTSPVLADTDADGINDNDEVAVGGGTILPDSDGDGILDGDEDHDFDGTSNSKEVTAGSNPYVSEVHLKAGVNFIHQPFEVPQGYSAFDWMQDLGGSVVVQRIERFDPELNTFSTAQYLSGTAQGEDFAIQSGEGYVVHLLQEVQQSFDRDIVCPGIQIQQGFNLIGFSCIAGGFSAYDLLEHLGGESSVSSVQRYNTFTGKYESATWHNGAPTGIDFPLRNTEAYVIYANSALGDIASPTDFTEHTVTSHSNNAEVKGSPVRIDGELKSLITISGTVSDNLSSVTVNGVKATVSGGIFTAELILTSGMHNIEIVVVNRDNLISRSVISIDVQEPVALEVTSHVDGQVIYQKDPIILGKIDPIIDEVLVNGRATILRGDTFRYGYYCYSRNFEPICDYDNYKERLNLDPGQHTITIEAFSHGQLIDTKTVNLDVQRFKINTLNPGLVTQALPSFVFEESRIGYLDSYDIFFNVNVTGGVESNITATSSEPVISGNQVGVSIDVDVLNALSGTYEKEVKVDFYTSIGGYAYSVYYLLDYEVPVATSAPEFTIDSPVESEDIFYSFGLVSGSYSHSVKEIRVNGETPAFFEGGYYSHNTDLSSGSVTVEAIGENPDLTKVKTVNFTPRVTEITMGPDRVYGSDDNQTQNFPAALNIGHISAGDIELKGAPSFVTTYGDKVSLNVSNGKIYKTLKHKYGLVFYDYYDWSSRPTVSGVYEFYIDWDSGGGMGGFKPYMHIPIKLTALESLDAPEVELYSHEEGDVIPESRAGISIRVSNDSAATVKINGVLAKMEEIRSVPFRDRTYSAIVELNEGTNNINVEVLGLNGLSTNKTYTLTVDTADAPLWK
ncbi:PQQ-binding-like beta-propeller repeat protein [Microbulbifer sp. MLAF003]|uniref:outer membrane protein assembly factor BamB family protein n=1 Tax=Microbulbifer sp. MLAF003 TaxID=3032582 RepID=UPI0024AE030C|nr:PQQ-binding-like beta-propeller repeat protein [Microbulbifer sp. MLAF003]WHI49549.1 PQQ-binding-like beta-propeller repeat protein [Microbulbifer sp. MLAF003]